MLITALITVHVLMLVILTVVMLVKAANLSNSLYSWQAVHSVCGETNLVLVHKNHILQA